MAKFVLTSAYTALGGTDLSAYINKSELSVEVEEKDITTFGSAGHKELLGGLKSGTLAIEFKNDVAAAALDSIIWPLLGTVVTFEVRNTSAVVGASNPKYTGSVLIKQWGTGGGVGDEASQSVSFPTSGTITRAVA